MERPDVRMKCFACDAEFQHSAGHYGHSVTAYQISVCDTCYEGNWDGWNPHIEEKLLAHLEEQGIPIPTRNEKGLLPRDGYYSQFS